MRDRLNFLEASCCAAASSLCCFGMLILFVTTGASALFAGVIMYAFSTVVFAQAARRS